MHSLAADTELCSDLVEIQPRIHVSRVHFESDRGISCAYMHLAPVTHYLARHCAEKFRRSKGTPLDGRVVVVAFAIPLWHRFGDLPVLVFQNF